MPVGVQLGPDPIFTGFDADGNPLAGGFVFTFAAGSNTPQATYTDFSGTVQNTNPVVLDAAGRAAIWFTAQSYKIVVQDANHVQQYVTDDYSVGIFGGGAVIFGGDVTVDGTLTDNGPFVANAGGTLNGVFGGNPTFSGSVGIPGTLTAGNVNATTVNTDDIRGTLTNGGNMTIVAHNGAAATAGESIQIRAGDPGAGVAAGGSLLLSSGIGGSAGGAGGQISFNSGNATAGNANGGSYSAVAGNGSGSGHGGDFIVTAGSGGASGNGGDITITPGTRGAAGLDGNVVIGGSGREIFNVNATTQAPSAASTGLGAGTTTMANYSTDTSGIINLNAGVGAVATGVVTITFHQSLGTNGSVCMFMLKNSTGTWDPQSTVIGGAYAAATATFVWDGNAVALTPASVYQVVYWIVGRQ